MNEKTTDLSKIRRRRDGLMSVSSFAIGPCGDEICEDCHIELHDTEGARSLL